MADDEYYNLFNYNDDISKKDNAKNLAKVSDFRKANIKEMLSRDINMSLDNYIDSIIDEPKFFDNPNNRIMLDNYDVKGQIAKHNNYTYKYRDMNMDTPYPFILGELALQIIWGVYKSVSVRYERTTLANIANGYVNVVFNEMRHGYKFSVRLDLSKYPKKYSKQAAVKMFEEIVHQLLEAYYENIIEKYDSSYDRLSENFELLKETLITIFDRPIGNCIGVNEDKTYQKEYQSTYQKIKGIKLLNVTHNCGSYTLLYLLKNKINNKLINEFTEEYGEYKTFQDFENFKYKVKIFNITKELIYTSNKPMMLTEKGPIKHKSFHILYHNNHYTPITNINSFTRINNSERYKFCEKCNKSTIHKICPVNELSINSCRKIKKREKDSFNTSESGEVDIPIYVYDIEAYSKSITENDKTKNYNEFALLVCQNINKNKQRIFRNIKDFLEYLSSKNRHIRIFAHNASGYDSPMLCNYMIKNNMIPKNVIKNGSKIVRFMYNKVEFVDSYRHLPMSLRDAAKTFRLGDANSMNKGFFPYQFYTEENKNYKGCIPDISYFETKRLNSQDLVLFNEWYNNYINNGLEYDVDSECIKYCKQDVFLLASILKKYNELMLKTGVNALLQNTIASTALTLFRTKFLKEDIVYRLHDDIDKFSRKAMYGGRTETFVVKYEGDSLYVDINSLYPSVQVNNRYPVGSPTIYKDRSILHNIKKYGSINNYLITLDKTSLFIADITVSESNLYMPYLCEKLNGRLMFNNRKKRGVWTSVDIIKAIKLGYIIEEIHELHEYDYITDLFTEYIDKLWEIKNQAKIDKNSGLYAISKLLLNSLWGKLGQKKLQMMSKYCKEEDFIKLCARESERKIEISDKVDYEHFSLISYYDNAFGTYVNVPIAAFVTSYGRLALYNGFEAVGVHNVLYCDTDSMIISLYDKNTGRLRNKKDIEKLINVNDKLGDWGYEEDGEILKKFVSIGPKSYAYILENGKECSKCKGFSKGSITYELYCKMIQDYYDNKPVNYTTTENILTRKNLMLCFEEQIKKINMDFVKRTLNDDYTTSPI